MAASLCDDFPLISKGLYLIVSDVIGPESIVKIRREKFEINNTLENCDRSDEQTSVQSGSRPEGFELGTSSDVDTVFIDRKAVVLTNSTLSMAKYYSKLPIFLMETEHVSPGYAFVKSLTCVDKNLELKKCIVQRGKEIYVSSKSIRESFNVISTSECHGPCQTSSVFGLDRDHVYALHCPFWPIQAVSFIKRSLHSGWPSHDVLTDICKDGCLLVPINSKPQFYSDMIDLEWRISFSRAEKKLIHSMNYCQFLCYGLLKLFLNEVIREKLDDKELLSSYIMKTAVFWAISENPSGWSPWNFLSNFWNAFRRILKWVSAGFCPNYFIPENNMFYGKINGERRKRLLGILHDLYLDGYRCILQCTSLNEMLTLILAKPRIACEILSEEELNLSKSGVEEERLRAIFLFDIYLNTADTEEVKGKIMNIIMLNPCSLVSSCAIRLCVNHALQAYAECLFFYSNPICAPDLENKCEYEDRKRAINILRKAKSFLFTNVFLLIINIYMTGNFQKTIEMIQYMQHKLQSKTFMYEWNLDEELIMTLLQQGMTHEALIKSSIVSHVKMDSFTTIEELKLECSVIDETSGGGQIYIPPLVFSNFLLIICYTNLGENHKRCDVLHELHSLLYHGDDGNHIGETDMAMSWEILGICQQLCGDRHGALKSYNHALDDEFNEFRQATMYRIESLGDSRISRWMKNGDYNNRKRAISMKFNFYHVNR